MEQHEIVVWNSTIGRNANGQTPNVHDPLQHTVPVAAPIILVAFSRRGWLHLQITLPCSCGTCEASCGQGEAIWNLPPSLPFFSLPFPRMRVCTFLPLCHFSFNFSMNGSYAQWFPGKRCLCSLKREVMQRREAATCFWQVRKR